VTTEIQTDRYSQIIRRVAGQIGPGGRVVESLTDLFPVVDLEDVPGELLLLGGTRLCFGGGALTGAAGEVARHQLFNPAGSDALITLTRVIMSSGPNTTFRWGRSAAALTTGIGTEIFRETRLLGTSLPVGQIRQDSTVAFSPGTNQAHVLASSPLILEDVNGVAILSPGQGFEFSSNTVASNTAASFFWRERPAEQSELKF